jgi:hypothetical protein
VIETTGLIRKQTHKQVDPKAATRRPHLPISRLGVLYRGSGRPRAFAAGIMRARGRA